MFINISKQLSAAVEKSEEADKNKVSQKTKDALNDALKLFEVSVDNIIPLNGE